MTPTFQELGLNPDILYRLAELDYAEPTPIQTEAIPPLLAGRDVLGQAQTGTGKTAAFTLPILQQLVGDGLQTLILTPTRELAIQVSEAVYRYGKAMNVRVLPIYGGQSYDRQQRRLQKGVQVVVGTPGRTLDLIRKGMLDVRRIRFLVLDEGDEMLQMGFIEDVEAILSATPADTRQTMLFSATFTKDILKLAEQYMRNALHIAIESQERTGENIIQRYYLVQERDKVAALSRLLEVEDLKNTLIFTRTKVGAAQLAETLLERGYPAVAMHGDLPQNERERILGRFRRGQLNILVATDVVGRGVDILDISHVINFDLPQLAIEYVHRIGRTGRAGRTGEAISFVTPGERRTLSKIEQYIRKPIDKAKLPSREDVLRRRDELFMGKLVRQIETTTEPDALLDNLLGLDYPGEQIVTALIQLVRSQEAERPLEEIRSVKETIPGREREREQSRKPRRRNRHGSEKGMVRLRMDVGRSNGIRPGDIVYTIASQSNIPGSVIGAIDIHQNETYLDVPENHVNAVLQRTKRTKIRGQAMNLVRA